VQLQSRILLVEDHMTTRDGTARLLADQGAIVTTAVDATSALKLLAEQRFEVILLDMMLPDMDGREVLRILERRRPEGLRGIIVLTGDLTRDRVSEIKQLGADVLIEKPVDIERLMQTLVAFEQEAL
jgi:two-component system OmpR family response regulator